MYGIFGFLHVVALSVLIWFFSLFDFVWMFIFCGEWKSTGNKYSLIESFPPFFNFCSDLCSRSHTVPVFLSPCSGKTSPRLLPYNLYHLTNMSKDIFLSFPWTFVPCLSPSLSYKSFVTPPDPLHCSVVLVAGFQLPVRKMSLQSIRAFQGGLHCRTHFLIASRQAGEQLQSLQHMLRRASAAVLAVPPSKACKSLS